MVDRKLTTSLSELTDHIYHNFSPGVSNIVPIQGGERSITYSFSANGKDFIIRINREVEGFQKDKNAYEDFQNLIPVPKMLKIGSYQSGYYAISEKAKGTVPDDTKGLSHYLIENIFLILDAIHVPAKIDDKYGLIDSAREAHFETWEEYIFKDYILVVKKNGDYYTWKEIYAKSKNDIEEFKNIEKRIKGLIKYIPKEKYFIHGDFGGSNLIVDDDKVTAVIDWSESMYGDFLFDIAYYAFWRGDTELIKMYKNYCVKKDRAIPYFEERILCHQLFIGLHSLAIYLVIDDIKEFKVVQAKLHRIFE